MRLLQIANSHLIADDAFTPERRSKIRRRYGWDRKIVVLTVCSLNVADRPYTGIDAYLDVIQRVRTAYALESQELQFVLCGPTVDGDIRDLRHEGLKIFPFAAGDKLVDLYNCADMYVCFSRWEEYNLGLSQAVAFGLPVIASDIPAHRFFGIDVLNSTEDRAEHLMKFVRANKIGRPSGKARVWKWSDHCLELERAISTLLTTSEMD
jgi:glycosyltransferase involved in cell wall biosynthesis